MSIFTKIAAKIVDSQENPNKIPLDEMNFRQRATHYTGQMLGAGVGKMMPDSMMQLLGDAIRNEKAAREEQRAQNQKQEQENKRKEQSDARLNRGVAGTNSRLDDLIKINKKMLQIMEEGGAGAFGGKGISGGVAAAAGAAGAGLWGMAKNVITSPGLLGTAARGGLAYGADAVAGGAFGLGKGTVDTKKDNENWNRMSILNKVESSVARTVEHVGDWIMPNTAAAARLSRIEDESKYFADKDAARREELIKQRLSADQRKQYEDDMSSMKNIDQNNMTPSSNKAFIRAMKAKRELDADNRRIAEIDKLKSAVLPDQLNERADKKMSEKDLPMGAVPFRNGIADLRSTGIHGMPNNAVALGSSKSILIQALEQQTAARQQNANSSMQEIRLDAQNIYIGSKNGGQLIKFEAPSITYEADKIEFKLRNGESSPVSPGATAMPRSSAGPANMPGAPGNDTPPAMMQALQQMGYNPGGSSAGSSGAVTGGANGSTTPRGRKTDQPGHGGDGDDYKLDRSRVAKELEDPETKRMLLARAQIEVGGQGPDAHQKWMESVLNRAAARGKSVKEIVDNSDGYYPRTDDAKWRAMISSPRDLSKKFDQTLTDVLAGSNKSNFATGNGSGGVGFGKNGYKTSSANGEDFGVEGKDRQWAQQGQQARQKWLADPNNRKAYGQSDEPTTAAGSGNFSWGNIDKSKLNPDLAAAAQAGAGYLPQGYSVRASSGFRPGDPRFHGKGMAADFEIVGPDGQVIPNAGKDSSGIYRQYAQHVYGWMQQNNPQAAANLAWGGSFPIPYGRRMGQADLMHFDMGGQRGRWTHLQPQNMGGMRGVDYSSPPPTMVATQSIKPTSTVTPQVPTENLDLQIHQKTMAILNSSGEKRKALYDELNALRAQRSGGSSQPTIAPGTNGRIAAASKLSQQAQEPQGPKTQGAQTKSDPMSEELDKIGYKPQAGPSTADSTSDPGKVGIARDYFERLFGNSPSGWS